VSGEAEVQPQDARPAVYIETSVISYLTADLSKDIVVLAHQKITKEWWERRSGFRLHTSALVIAEASRGDPRMVAQRLELLRPLPLLEVPVTVDSLARGLLDRGALPPKAKVDATHIAISAVNGMDYLLTWNCKHIANAAMRKRIEALCREAGFEPPIMCTPEELLGRD
jgi:hypothetical protein